MSFLFTHRYQFCTNVRSQGVLLGRLELLLASNLGIIKSVNDILSNFYELEILSEEVLIDWYDVPSAKYVTAEVLTSIHKSAKPFIEWLKNADEEDEEEDIPVKGKKEEKKVEKKEEKPAKVVKQEDSDSDDDCNLDDL